MEAEARELALLLQKAESDVMIYIAKLEHLEKKEKQDFELRKRLEAKVRESQENEARYAAFNIISSFVVHNLFYTTRIYVLIGCASLFYY
jgi:hypothetical protein